MHGYRLTKVSPISTQLIEWPLSKTYKSSLFLTPFNVHGASSKWHYCNTIVLTTCLQPDACCATHRASITCVYNTNVVSWHKTNLIRYFLRVCFVFQILVQWFEIHLPKNSPARSTESAIPFLWWRISILTDSFPNIAPEGAEVWLLTCIWHMNDLSSVMLQDFRKIYWAVQASGLDTVWLTLCRQKLVSLFTASRETGRNSQCVPKVTPSGQATNNASTLQDKNKEITRNVRHRLLWEVKFMNITWDFSPE